MDLMLRPVATDILITGTLSLRLQYIRYPMNRLLLYPFFSSKTALSLLWNNYDN